MKKWPFFVFGTIGTTVAVVISWLFVVKIEDTKLKKVEQPEMISDFSSWISSGFTAVFDYESKVLIFPDGNRQKTIVTYKRNYSVLAVSKYEVLSFCYKKINNISKRVMVATDWQFANERELCYFDHNCTFFTSIDGNIVIEENNSNNKYEVNPSNGTIVSLSNIDGIMSNKTSIGTFSFEEGQYFINTSDGNQIIVEQKSIDNRILELIDKWNFKPSRCRTMLNGNICCSFHRILKNSIGQQAFLLAELSIDGAIANWQFCTIDSSYQKQNWAFDIMDSFADKIEY